MAVPKRKTTPSRRGNRRAHDALKPIQVSYDKETGEIKLPHHASAFDGMYNGKLIYRSKRAKQELKKQQAAQAAEQEAASAQPKE